jgi:hypothetical protein
LLQKPRQDLLAELIASQAGGGSTGIEAAQRLAAVLTAAAAASNLNGDSDDQKIMKVPPMTLPSGLGPFSHDLLWRYPNPFLPQPPPSPLETQLKSQLPGGLGHDPRHWNREDVTIFLRYCEREFDLDQIDMEKFQMNGNNSVVAHISFCQLWRVRFCLPFVSCHVARAFCLLFCFILQEKRCV